MGKVIKKSNLFILRIVMRVKTSVILAHDLLQAVNSLSKQYQSLSQ